MSKKTIKPTELGAAIERELTIYGKETTERVNTAGAEAMKRLVSITKATAPVGKRTTHYRSRITSSERASTNGSKRYIWHVKKPDYRLTHLLVKSHATKDGGRTRANPFLKNALDQVLPEYENNVKEAVKGES